MIANNYKPRILFIPLMVLTIIALVTSIFAFRIFGNKKESSIPLPTIISQATATPTSEPNNNLKKYEIKTLGLTFYAPFEYDVKIDEKEKDLINFYIQNYPIDAPPPDPYFQMYGIYNANDLTYENIQKLKKDLTEVKEANIAGYKTIQGYTKGEKVRYTYYFLLEKGYFIISVSDKTKTNIDKANTVLGTLEQKNTNVSKSCIVTGCNGELCVEEGSDKQASVCLWEDSYMCYKTAKCVADNTGTCGWVMDEKLINCLAKYDK